MMKDVLGVLAMTLTLSVLHAVFWAATERELNQDPFIVALLVVIFFRLPWSK